MYTASVIARFERQVKPCLPGERVQMAKKVNKKYQETESSQDHCDGCTGIAKIQFGM